MSSGGTSFGTNTEAVRKRVMYFGTSTIYEGMPVCYDNSTTNVLGFDPYDSTASTTTTEGYQNEGKFLRVENPNADNVSMFAGVVAHGKNVGKTGVTTGVWIDIFIPNGAVVPVRTDNNCLIDQTILAITTGSQELGVPLATDSRPVAIARETIDRGTAGLVLAELCPDRFIYQDMGGTALSIDDADTGTASVVNKINVNFLQTSGNCIALWVQATLAGAGVSQTGYATCLYCEQDIAVAVGGQTPCAAFWTNLTGGTQTEPIFGAQVAIYETGATLTSANITAILALTSQFAENPLAGNHNWIYLENNGTYAPDSIFRCNSSTGADVSAAASTSEPTWATSHLKIPFIICGTGTRTTYYLHATAD